MLENGKKHNTTGNSRSVGSSKGTWQQFKQCNVPCPAPLLAVVMTSGCVWKIKQRMEEEKQWHCFGLAELWSGRPRWLRQINDRTVFIRQEMVTTKLSGNALEADVPTPTQLDVSVIFSQYCWNNGIIMASALTLGVSNFISFQPLLQLHPPLFRRSEPGFSVGNVLVKMVLMKQDWPPLSQRVFREMAAALCHIGKWQEQAGEAWGTPERALQHPSLLEAAS